MFELFNFFNFIPLFNGLGSIMTELLRSRNKVVIAEAVAG